MVSVKEIFAKKRNALLEEKEKIELSLNLLDDLEKEVEEEQECKECESYTKEETIEEETLEVPSEELE